MSTKLFILFLGLITSIALIASACGSPTPSPSAAPAPTTSSAAPAPAKTSATTTSPTSASTSPAAVATKTYEFKLSYHMPANSSPGQAFLQWTDEVTAASKGQIKITHYAAQTLAKQAENYSAVTTGLCDIALLATGSTPGRFPLSELIQLPMLFNSAKVAGQASNELLEKYALNNEYKDVKLLWVFPMPPHALLIKNPVQKLEDVKGQKIRIEGKYEAAFVEGLGGAGVYLSPMDLYSSLERGVIDGAIFQWDGVLQYGLEKVAKNRFDGKLLCRGMPLAMNKNKWNSLPADIQKIFTDTSGVKHSTEAGAKADELNISRRQQVVDYDKQAGNPGIFVPSDTEMAKWRTVAKAAQEKWAADCEAAGLPGKAMLADANALAEKYSK